MTDLSITATLTQADPSDDAGNLVPNRPPQARDLKHALIAGHPLGMEIWRDDAAWELRWRE